MAKKNKHKRIKKTKRIYANKGSKYLVLFYLTFAVLSLHLFEGRLDSQIWASIFLVIDFGISIMALIISEQQINSICKKKKNDFLHYLRFVMPLFILIAFGVLVWAFKTQQDLDIVSEYLTMYSSFSGIAVYFLGKYESA